MSLFDILSGDSETGDIIHGVKTAIVSDNKDPENLGRVKVKYPWLSDDNESNWIRMAVLMAGPGRGSYFLPEIGDELLVAFQDGEINAPFIIGALWNGKANPPANNKDEKNNIRIIHSRKGHTFTFHDGEDEAFVEIKTKKGHTVKLDDSKDKEKIELKTAANHQIILNDKEGGPKIELIDKTGKNKIIIDSDKNKISIESAQEVSISSGKINIEAKESITLKAGGSTVTIKPDSVSIKGPKISIKGDASATLEGSAQVQVKGGVATMEASGIMTIKGTLIKLN